MADRVLDDPAVRAGWATGELVQLSLAHKARVAFRGALIVLALLVLVPVHYAWRALRYGSPIPMIFLRIACRICGMQVTVHGKALRRNVIFLSNHVSWLDILAIAGTSGSAFVAKAELGAAPGVGWLARLNRTVFVERENRMAVSAQAAALREALLDAWSVTIFPEGTTTDGQSLLPFKSSMLRALEPPPEGIMVQPILLDYGAIAEWIGWIGVEGGMNNMLRILARPGHFRVHIHFLTPFDPVPFANRKGIAAEARLRVEAKLTETLGHAPRPFRFAVGPVRYVPGAVAA